MRQLIYYRNYLSFRTGRSRQKLETQIRLLPECWKRSSLIRVYSVYNSFCIFWTHYSSVKPLCSNFRVITSNFSGVRTFRIFTVNARCSKVMICYLAHHCLFARMLTLYASMISSNEPHRDKTNKMACVPNEDSDQPGHPPSLIRVFAGHSVGS